MLRCAHPSAPIGAERPRGSLAERCTIAVLQSTTLVVSEWDTEAGFDIMVINSQSFSGSTSPAGVAVTAGSSIHCEPPRFSPTRRLREVFGPNMTRLDSILLPSAGPRTRPWCMLCGANAPAASSAGAITC